MATFLPKYTLEELSSDILIIQPDNTFYESVKGISLIDKDVSTLPIVDIPAPPSLKLTQKYGQAWKKYHSPLIDLAYHNSIVTENVPYRTIFPGSFIPGLSGEIISIGDLSFNVFKKILSTVKERIPDLRHLKKIDNKYIYSSKYKPFTKTIAATEEVWGYENIVCPSVQAISFPMPPSYEFEERDFASINTVLALINKKCGDFCNKHIGKGKKRSYSNCAEIFSFIHSMLYLFNDGIIPAQIIKACDEVMSSFDREDSSVDPCLFLFEVYQSVSYLYAVKDYDCVASGPYSTYWMDVLKLPLENLVETELCDIHRVLREIRTYFTLGFAPIIVHFDKKFAYNVDGTHRHYAMLSIELLRRLKLANRVESIRKINLNSKESYEAGN